MIRALSTLGRVGWTALMAYCALNNASGSDAGLAADLWWAILFIALGVAPWFSQRE